MSRKPWTIMDALHFLILFVYIDSICISVQGQSSEGDVRLRRGDSTASGYVEIVHNGVWGRVCDTGWTHENAHVICKQLDYNGAQFPSNRPAQTANVALPVWLNNLGCKGSEKQLSQCPGAGTWLQAATLCQTASVTCTPYLAQHLGCYNDNFERALPSYQNCAQEPRCKCDFTNTGCINDNLMTVELCKDVCCNGAVKYAFYGVEAGNQCFCGVSTAQYKRWGQLENAECHTQCAGNPGESCGADYKINVYGCNLGCEVPGRLTPNLIATPQLEVKLYTVGDTISFNCVPGNTLTGAAQIACQAGGSWSGAVPTCQQVTQTEKPVGPTCTPPLGNSLLFSPIKVSYALGDSVIFSCATGFQLTGSQTLTCQTSGTWNGALPTCQRIGGCPALTGLDANAVPSTLATAVGTRVTFTCKAGYVLLAGSNPFKLCDNNGWTGPNPVCQAIIPAVTCPKPQIPPKSSYTPEKDVFVPGDTVTIKCALGYKPKGSAELTCTNQGQWSQVVLECIAIICDPLPAYPNVIPSSTEVVFATSVSFRCATGFEMTTEQTPYRTCHTNGWVGPEPVCSAITCGAVPQYPHATASTTQVTAGTKVTYTCEVGYQTIDRNLVTKTCQTSRNWEPADKVECQIINCGPLPKYPNAFPSTESTTFGIVTYSCHPGYSLPGNIKVSKQCTAAGTWTGPDPVCQPTVCAPLPQYPFAIPSTTSTAVATLVMFTCQAGTLLTGSTPSKTCGANGQWTGNDPNCKDIDECAAAPCKNGAACVNLLNKYVCNCPFGFSGTNCETVGGGTGNAGATACGAVPIYDHAIPSATTILEVSTQITYSCEAGYQHEGNPPYKQCLPTGIWDGQTPQCLPVNCGRPEVLPHVSIGNAQDFTFGQTVTYMCTDRTLSPSPYSTVTCESTKLWSANPPPECVVPVAVATTKSPIDPKAPNPVMTTDNASNGNQTGSGTVTVDKGGLDGNDTPTTSNNSAGLPVSIWIVILMFCIALAFFILGFILVRRQHESVRKKFGYPDKKPRKPRSEIGSTNQGDGTLTAVAVTPTFGPRGIPLINEPSDGDSDTITSSLPGIDPNDELDLRPQTQPSAPYDEYTYENEVEPEYTASDEGTSEGFSQSGSEVDEPISFSAPEADGSDQIEDAVILNTAAATEEAAPPTPDEPGETGKDTGETGEDKKDRDEKIEDESQFIDNLIDNAKGKVDDCIIA